ncbi:MAG: PH domain-containing protein [Candidatus Moranbacteria bacterium]|nr:PH domain-containing protein [Candidatus Moranbacteria bacterium]
MRNLSFVRFPGKHEEERVIAVYHRHWFDIFSHLFLSVFLSVILLGGFLILPGLFPGITESPNASFFFFLQDSFLLFLWVSLFLIWIDVYFDVWIITNERIVNIEQKDLFTRRVSELRFHTIQDVTSEVNGILPSILDFGDVLVQTAGESPRFIFHNIPNPVGVKDTIMKLAERGRGRAGVIPASDSPAA